MMYLVLFAAVFASEPIENEVYAHTRAEPLRILDEKKDRVLARYMVDGVLLDEWIPSSDLVPVTVHGAKALPDGQDGDLYVTLPQGLPVIDGQLKAANFGFDAVDWLVAADATATTYVEQTPVCDSMKKSGELKEATQLFRAAAAGPAAALNSCLEVTLEREEGDRSLVSSCGTAKVQGWVNTADIVDESRRFQVTELEDGTEVARVTYLSCGNFFTARMFDVSPVRSVNPQTDFFLPADRPVFGARGNKPIGKSITETVVRTTKVGPKWAEITFPDWNGESRTLRVLTEDLREMSPDQEYWEGYFPTNMFGQGVLEG